MTLFQRTSDAVSELETCLGAYSLAPADARGSKRALDALAEKASTLTASVRKLEAHARESDPEKRLYSADASAKCLALAARFQAVLAALEGRRAVAEVKAQAEAVAEAQAAAQAKEAAEVAEAAEAAKAAAEQKAAEEARAAAERASALAQAAQAAAQAKEREAAQAVKAKAEAAALAAAAATAAAAAAKKAEEKRVLDAAIARALDAKRKAAAAAAQPAPPPGAPAPPAASAPPPGHVHELTGGAVELRALLTAHAAAIVDWSAPWCGPCRAVAPAFASTAAQHPGVLFISINTEAGAANAALTREAAISAFPTFHAYLGASRTDEWRGADMARLRAVAGRLSGASPASSVASQETSPGMAQRVASALGELRRHTDLTSFEAACRSLLTFVSNVCAHPSEQRFRRVRLSNAAFAGTLGAHAGGMEAMTAFGFAKQSVDGEQVLAMSEAAARDPQLPEVKRMLEDALRQAGATSSGGPPGASAVPPLLPPSSMASLLTGAGASALAASPMARAAAAQLASNPGAIAALMSNPQAQAMLRQMSGGDPAMAHLLSNPQLMAQVAQLAAPQFAALAQGASAGASGVAQGGAGGGADALAGIMAALGQPPAQQTAMSEDEELAEAIRRSLEPPQ